MNEPASNSAAKGRIPLGEETFRFECGPTVPCFGRCCHKPDLELYPYDVVRLARRLGMKSGDFLARHTVLAKRTNPHFPSVMLRMERTPGQPCPFLSPEGCGIYEDRPDACRMFPLERGVSVIPFQEGSVEEKYFLQELPWCKGHGLGSEKTVADWVADQNLAEYNRMGELWTEMSLLFRRNPWGPEGAQSKNFKMAYTACYDTDHFRDFVFKSTFLKRYEVDPEWLEKIEVDNAALLEFGLDWLKYFLFNARPKHFKAVTPG